MFGTGETDLWSTIWSAIKVGINTDLMPVQVCCAVFESYLQRIICNFGGAEMTCNAAFAVV